MDSDNFEAVYKRNIEVISKAVTVEGELENSVLVNTFINALKADAADAMTSMTSVDLDDKVTLHKIQLRVALYDYLQRLICGIDAQHKQAAIRIQDMEKDVSYEQE